MTVPTPRQERAADVAAVLAAGFRDGLVRSEDVLRIIRHEMRTRQTNRKLDIPLRSTSAQAIIEKYAALGQRPPQNGSDEALHADHVHPLKVTHLLTWHTPEDWLAGLHELDEVVCVTATENYRLERQERLGVTGESKYQAEGITFVGHDGRPAVLPN